MVEFLIILFGISMLYLSSSTRLETYIKMLMAQGIILFVIIILDFYDKPSVHLVLSSLEALIFKGIVIPLFLIRLIRRNEIFREVEPFVSNFFSMFITSFIFMGGFLIAFLMNKYAHELQSLYFGVSISTIVASLFIILTRKKIITHVMGFCMLENGIFLLSLSEAKEVPAIVSIGILLDIFVAIFLLGIFVNKIKSTFDDIHIDELSSLKD